MHRLPKIFLLLISSVLLFFSACRYSKLNRANDCSTENVTSNQIIPVIQNNNTIKFKANIGVMKNNFSGIVLVKQTDSLHQHIVFVNELGMKLFNFNVVNNEVNATYVFEPINKPALVDALKRNMKHLLMIGLYNKPSQKCLNENQTLFKTQNENHYYFFSTTDQNKLQTQYVFYKKKLESKIDYTFDHNTNSYSSILCKQKGFGNISIELQRLVTE